MSRSLFPRTSLPGRQFLSAVALFFLGGVATGAPSGENLYSPYPQVANLSSGMSWPAGQALPTFATPNAVLDTILVQDLSPDERITFSALQGLINKTRPRVYLLDSGADEGTYTWANTAVLGLGSRITYTNATRFNLISKYANQVSGLVLYDPAISPHYRNLASTVAGLTNALPVTAAVRSALISRGLNLPVVVDLTTLSFTEPVDIYNYLYEHYWPQCNKRVIVSANPADNGDLHHTRDIAAATGGAVLWLSTTNSTQRGVLQKFFGDMTAGEAVVLGWYTTERSGVTLATSFGIGTIPADHYISGTVYGGTDHRIRVPQVPAKPPLENKIYIAIFVSDGDNAQYVQRAMRRIWSDHAASRGKVPINWTVAPGMVDLGPGLLNYYYTTATANDCFVSGPSGMGYLMPMNTYSQNGAAAGSHLDNPVAMAGYARLTETYMQRAGLRVITIWDNATPMQRATYEEKVRNLYGMTVQRFSGRSSVLPSVEGGRIYVDRLSHAYAETYSAIRDSLTSRIQDWDGKSPMFIATQASVWGEMKPNRIVDLCNDLNAQYPGKLVFVRADHYFNLFNEANGLPFNLSMSAQTTVAASDLSNANAVKDGTPYTTWSTAYSGTRALTFNFGRRYNLTRYVIRHAGDTMLNPSLNTRDFRLQVSLDGTSWSTIDMQTGNEANVTDVEFPAVTAQFARIIVDNSGADAVTRIADVEFYGAISGETIPPVPDPPSYLAWMDSLGAGEKPPEGQRGVYDKPAGDGVSNLAKYAFGLKPLIPTRPEETLLAPTDDTMAVEFVRSKTTTAEIGLEGSTDLVTWSPVEFVIESREDVGVDRERVRFITQKPDADAYFLRLRIDLNE